MLLYAHIITYKTYKILYYYRHRDVRRRVLLSLLFRHIIVRSSVIVAAVPCTGRARPRNVRVCIMYIEGDKRTERLKKIPSERPKGF